MQLSRVMCESSSFLHKNLTPSCASYRVPRWLLLACSEARLISDPASVTLTDPHRKSYELFSFANTGLSLHEAFLAGWGMPIGELFDLRRLAERCDALRQWTFLFTSMVLITHGGIASPPNAQAIL